MVKQMWNVYKHSSVAKLPGFWRDAFGAAYQDLTSEIANVRNSAFWEIAKMSFRAADIYDSPPAESAARYASQWSSSNFKPEMILMLFEHCVCLIQNWGSRMVWDLQFI